MPKRKCHWRHAVTDCAPRPVDDGGNGTQLMDVGLTDFDVFDGPRDEWRRDVAMRHLRTALSLPTSGELLDMGQRTGRHRLAGHVTQKTHSSRSLLVRGAADVVCVELFVAPVVITAYSLVSHYHDVSFGLSLMPAFRRTVVTWNGCRQAAPVFGQSALKFL